MGITKRFALISYRLSILGNYSPNFLTESDDIEELKAVDTSEIPIWLNEVFAIVEQIDGKIYGINPKTEMIFTPF